jgi:oligoribonuclease NrnB/cAMP/cGMP phosphodiesterase (DHH superfamily)
MKIKLFTHTDLDGVGCAVVANVAFGAENVSVEYCDYNQINDKIKYFLWNEVKANDYDRIFITDISVDEETAEFINNHPLGKQRKIQLVDHHATALWLAEKYEWCEVRTEESNLFPHPITNDKREKVLSSGTSLFYKFLRNKHLPNIQSNKTLKWFAERVRSYDCWEWSNVFNDNHPKKLNDLLYIVGREKFVERFSIDPLPAFNETESTILEIEEHRINKYIWYKKKDVKKTVWKVGAEEYNIAYVFAEQNISLLGNAIAEEYGNDVDFVVIINVSSNSISLRGIHSDIDLGRDVAKYYGGGGHPKASGFSINEQLREKLFQSIINMEE